MGAPVDQGKTADIPVGPDDSNTIYAL